MHNTFGSITSTKEVMQQALANRLKTSCDLNHQIDLFHLQLSFLKSLSCWSMWQTLPRNFFLSLLGLRHICFSWSAELGKAFKKLISLHGTTQKFMDA